MSFYIYENWRAEHKAVIHEGECGSCKNGNGCHPKPSGNRNGQWHGPFETLDTAHVVAIHTGRPVREHHCV